MSEHMKKPLTNQNKDVIRVHHAGAIYQIPKRIAEKYRVSEETVSAGKLFASINKKYTKPGALLQGIRIRESLTQVEMAEKLCVTQSDISQMERGVRKIGRNIAKRIEAIFDVDYRSFLE